MAKSKRGLGKGLDALIGQASSASHSSSAPPAPVHAHERLQEVAVEQIQRGQYQPRRHFEQEALEELAHSIKEQGLMQPIVVRPLAANKYEIIAGERRWRAAQLAGLDSISAIIKDIDDESTMVMALIENIQREDLNPVEEALALQRLQQEFKFSQQQVADAVGKPRSTVANILRLTSLQPQVLGFLEHGDIETGHAKLLLSLESDKQLEWAKKTIDKMLTVRQLETLLRKPQTTQTQAPVVLDPNIRRLETDLAEKLGAKVTVQQKTKNKGKLVIHYNSLDELDGILNHMA